MAALNGRRIVLTGAGRGIGRALAGRLLAEGARVVATVRSRASADDLRALGDDRLTVEQLDIADGAAIGALARRLAANAGDIDVLINNAGTFLDEDREQRPSTVTTDVWRRTFETNLFGTAAVCVAFAPAIADGGRIVNVSSTMGQLADGLPAYATAYSVSKTALNAYTSALAGDLAARRIIVDAVHPGWVKTEMGGAGAPRDPADAAADIAWHAARPPEAGPSGAFWHERRVIPW